MSNIITIRSVVFLMPILCTLPYSHVYGQDMPGVKGANQKIAAGCLPSSSWAELNINNVRTRIQVGGDMWWDLQGMAKYEIPKGTGKTSLFAGALWIGGVDPNGQLRIAAQRYRQAGIDFWPGPLTIDGTASIDGVTCAEWDRSWTITRSEVREFLQHIDENTGLFIPTAVYPAPPEVIRNWPWQGDISKGQSPYLAPFFDRNNNGIYEWEQGDYPYYLFNRSQKQGIALSASPETEAGITTGGRLADQVLQGDQTIWWVFNDKGNIHTETGGEAIGLEIRAQAYAFATDDALNDATFYSYEIINRSTTPLVEAWFGLFVDPDLGYGYDDMVGCDVYRGLGYCYNGTEIDGSGQAWTYGENPPAVGINFYGGPYMDPDGLDNPMYQLVVIIDPVTGDTLDITNALVCGPNINGSNFGDGVPDNERYGITRFHSMTGWGATAGLNSVGDAMEYYNLLRGIWGGGSKMIFGGNGHIMNGGYGPEADFMFPGDSDPWFLGTGGIAPYGNPIWTEEMAGNQPYDRIFMQSAGPFTLESGGVNYVTIGVPWARAASGGPRASLEKLKMVDDQLRRLFRHCFYRIKGPDAPDLVIRELNQELIMYLVNRPSNENFQEDYAAWDMDITFHDTVPSHLRGDSLYRFEGYQIFQVRDASVTIADIAAGDADKARLLAQCDIKNDISRIINFEYDDYLQISVPREKVNGANEGLFHSLRVTEDLFAEGNRRLINHKTYHYIAIAYAHNEYTPYEIDPAIPEKLNGQKTPYISSSYTQSGGTIVPVSAIPHIPSPHSGGTKVNAKYGDDLSITRIEGHGNGGMVLDLSPESIDEIMSGAPHKALHPKYLHGRGPINVKIIDPLSVKPGNFTLLFDQMPAIESAHWTLYYEYNGLVDTIRSDRTIAVGNEQLLLEYGLSITIAQVTLPGDLDHTVNNGLITSSITFSDSSIRWLTGVPDLDQGGAFNWIRSGTLVNEWCELHDDDDYYYTQDIECKRTFIDPEAHYERVVSGTWAPYRLASRLDAGPQWNDNVSTVFNRLENLYSVDVVFTSDKSKWTRCPVIETGSNPDLTEGNAYKMHLRRSASKDRDGRTGTTEATKNGTQPLGMSYFPGYAINIETGERLNLAFGEDSWLQGENGRDMLFNPTSRYTTSLGSQPGSILFGGKHFLYVFGSNSALPNRVPTYDEGVSMHQILNSGNTMDIRRLYGDAMWVSIPMPAQGYNLDDPSKIPTEATVRIRVSRPYMRNYSATTGAINPINDNYPVYSWSTDGLATGTHDLAVAKSALDLIRAVPNPYYAHSGYETHQLDNKIKITNLPERCTVSIYSVNGTLVRRFGKDDPTTYLEWDLKNYAGIPIAGGVYIIHVNTPGVGEKVIKWFGSLRPVDLMGF